MVVSTMRVYAQKIIEKSNSGWFKGAYTRALLFILLHIFPTITTRNELAEKLQVICSPHQDGRIRLIAFLTAQLVNVPDCSPHCFCNAERPAGKLRKPF